ncbi:MAG: NTP transferase domain-containing protein [Clostridia bacterium]|nr:NTP transferase domain-containing protein [Clostridia bacterium]
MSLQAIIMAGGEGMRLRPLTYHIPKPLVPLLGEPVMGYSIKLLKENGVRDIGVTLWYQPEKIRHAFGGGEGYGVSLRYYEETEPLGTAGSVKMAKDEIKEPFFVLSGDGLTDCDLSGAMRFHREKKALATLVLKRVPIPLAFGVVMTDGESRITRFIEKPGWSRVFSDLVNTGAYILNPEIFDYIPDTGAPDFGKDIFPALLAGGLPVYGYETEGYWCDVGDLKTYLMAQRDLLEDRVRLPHEKGVHPDARIAPSARLEGACFIGPGASIGPGAVVRDSVIGENCVIGAGAVVEDCCLWTGAQAQAKARISGTVLCDGASVQQGAETGEGCALGKKAVARALSQLRPGVRLWPYVKTAAGAAVNRSMTQGEWNTPHWTARGAECDSAVSACDLCGAFLRVTGAKRVIAAQAGDSSLHSLTAAALAASGAKVLDAGEITPPMLQFLIRELKAGGGVFAGDQALSFFGRQGLPLTDKQKTALDGCVLRQELPEAFAGTGGVVPFSGGEEMYLSGLLSICREKPLYSPVAVFCDSRRVLSWAEEGLKRMNARDIRLGTGTDARVQPGETGFLLSESGEDAAVLLPEGPLSPEEKVMLLLWLIFQREKALFDLPGTFRAAEKIAPLQIPDDSPACARQRSLMGDGLAALLLIAEGMKDGPLTELMRQIPRTHLSRREVPCDIRDKGRILRTLCGQADGRYAMGEGLRISHRGGFATIVPDAHRPAVRVTGEAPDGEFAQELCDFYVRKIQKIADGQNYLETMP